MHVFQSGKPEIKAAAGFTRAHKLALRAVGRELPVKGAIIEVRIIGNKELAPPKYQDEFKPIRDDSGVERDCLVVRAA
jgi:hypothetical protein